MSPLSQYLAVTASYWAFTITDGALRMLVVLYFHNLGYSPIEIASLFLFYEFFGIITNLFGGWLGARVGLNKTMHLGMLMQSIALGMLCVPPSHLNVPYVMLAQAISGIAKDFSKMSAKSSLKVLVPKDQEDRLYKWVALLTGSKNALKGAGFFIGSILLGTVGFRLALLYLMLGLFAVFLLSVIFLKNEIGKGKNKPKFKDLFSKSRSINLLAMARFLLFGSRDIWFVIALPVFLQAQLNWEHADVGSFMAVWIIFYGVIQAIAPRITGTKSSIKPNQSSLYKWCLLLAIIPILISYLIPNLPNPDITLVVGLIIFGGIFAINSSLHSYFILYFADRENTSMDVGFYYMANAGGRLIGTILSGLLFQKYGLDMCLYFSTGFLFSASFFAWLLCFNQSQNY